MQASGSDSSAPMTNDTPMVASAMDELSVDHTVMVHGAKAECGDPGAEATIALWRAVDLGVSTVIGRRGTAAVLRRALVIVRRTHGWMSEPLDDLDFDGCVHTLNNALASQAPEQRASGKHALETVFHDLLASLVGAALAAQLLRAAWSERQIRIEAPR